MDYDFDDELEEICESVDNTIAILQEALDEIKAVRENADEEASNDTFYILAQMLRNLRVKNNMSIETLCEDALEDNE